MAELWKSVNYKTPVRYFVNTYIREYDLSAANISALLFTGRISQEEYFQYLNMEKSLREKAIGLLIKKDKSIYKDIQTGIIEAKRQLLSANNVDNFNVVAVKNDAVFIVGEPLQYTSFPPLTFRCKNVYTIFLQLKDLEIYYNDFLDNSGVNINIDIKGISDDTLLCHQNGMFDLVCDVCYRLQRENIKDTMYWISEMYRLFITRSLPKQYYRNFDAISGYTLNTLIHSIVVSDIDDSMISSIDINRNLSILRDLLGIISDIYRRQNQ